MRGRSGSKILGVLVAAGACTVALVAQTPPPPPAPPAAAPATTAAPAQGRPPAGGAPAGAPGMPANGPAGRGPAAPPLPALTPAAIEKAAPILAATRTALGGPKLEALKSLNATGRTKRVRGNNLVPIEFEMDLEFPDKFVRKDEFPAEETDPTSAGFNGTDLVQNPPPAAPPARAGAPPVPPAALEAQRKARLLTVKQDFVRFALGMFAQSFEAYPLTFGYAAQAQAPQGTADVLDVRGEGNFGMRFFIDQATHMPIMVSWTLPPTNVIVTIPGAPPPATVAPGAVVVAGPPAPPANATKEQQDQYAKDVLAVRSKAQATPVEHRIYFADYREVDGVKLPFRLRRAIGVDTTEETTFDRYRVNPKIAPAKFAVAK